MRFSSRAVLALLVSCACTGPAMATGVAGEATEASLSWHLGFGGRTLQAGYGLALGYRSSDRLAPVSRLVELNVSPDLASASVAGLPLFARSYQAKQTEAQEPDAAAGSQTTPWYTRKWVLWTAGGIAATAALAGSGSSGSNESGTCSGACNSNTGASVSGVSGDGIGCVNGTCAVPCKTPDKPAGCVPFASTTQTTSTDFNNHDRLRRLDAGTGGMGDLIAR